MEWAHTVEMMVLSRATRNMLIKTEISKRVVLVAIFASSGLLASCLSAISWGVLPDFIVSNTVGSPTAEFAVLEGIDTRSTMAIVEVVVPLQQRESVYFKWANIIPGTP